MTTTALVALARDGLLLALVLAAPIVLAGLVAGALTAVIGAVTQARDPSIGLAPRLVAVAIAVVVSAPLVAHQLVAFAAHVMALVPAAGGG
ncbi:MAG TPA: flagellar biosynthetic protein FliQ [Kofleriaceae bacterium]|nr:flagellar biosynthetic protein FliQ [Kofleriaceae bacterium]